MRFPFHRAFCGCTSVPWTRTQKDNLQLTSLPADYLLCGDQTFFSYTGGAHQHFSFVPNDIASTPVRYGERRLYRKHLCDTEFHRSKAASRTAVTTGDCVEM